jgi:hypothetical protein
MSKISAGEQQGNDRIRFVDRDGKRILMVDLSVCTAREAEETVRRVPDVVTAEPRGSVRILTDFKGSSFDSGALRAIKETAVFDKPFVKKSALVGTLSLPREFHDEMEKFSRRDFAIFATREEAMQWLVES